jgi:hypothetical protein
MTSGLNSRYNGFSIHITIDNIIAISHSYSPCIHKRLKESLDVMSVNVYQLTVLGKFQSGF